MEARNCACAELIVKLKNNTNKADRKKGRDVIANSSAPLPRFANAHWQ
jgi:hypothetical protein